VYYTKLRYYTYRAFGVPPPGITVAPLANMHNVATTVNNLDGTYESETSLGRTWLCPQEVRSEPIVMYIAENQPSDGIITGLIGVRRRKICLTFLTQPRATLKNSLRKWI
jgi:hypothetical protein